jgi:hypothetical protein
MPVIAGLLLIVVENGLSVPPDSNPVSRSIKISRPDQQSGLFYCAVTASYKTTLSEDLFPNIPQKQIPDQISPICALFVP